MRATAKRNRRTVASLTAIAAALVLGWLLTVPAVAQTPAAPAVMTLSAVQLDGDTATVSTPVVDAGGNAVAGLAASAFTATVDGAPATVVSANTALDPALSLGLVVVVDTSGSMAGASLTAAKSAITSLVTSTRPGDHVALITFSSAVATPVPFSTDPKALNTAVAALNANGNTALYAAVAQAAKLTASAPDPRKAVVLLTDGEDFGNASAGVTRDQAIAAATAAGVPFYVVGLGTEVDTAFLSAVGKGTGGTYLPAAGPAALASLYANISERLRLQYALHIAIPAGLAAGQHRLRVTAGSASAEAAFTKASIAASPSLAGLDTPVSEPRTVTVDNLPGNVRAEFTIDGKPIPAEADGRSVRLDPYAFDPAAPHAISVSYGAGDVPKTFAGTFTVAALAPKLISPTSLPNLQPGDLVRFTVQAQPGGSSHAVFTIDGQEAGRSDTQPFEFTMPRTNVAAGSHTFAATFENSAGRTEQTFGFEGPTKSGSPTAAYVLIAIAAAAALASALYGARLAVARVGRREGPVDLDAAAVHLRSRAMGEYSPEAVAAVPVSTGPAAPWGTLVVTNGRQAGERFSLVGERELIGSAKGCAVRLTDPSVRPAHAVMTREPAPTVTRSAPDCPLTVDGAEARAASLHAGSIVIAGTVELRFEAPA